MNNSGIQDTVTFKTSQFSVSEFEKKLHNNTPTSSQQSQSHENSMKTIIITFWKVCTYTQPNDG